MTSTTPAELQFLAPTKIAPTAPHQMLGPSKLQMLTMIGRIPTCTSEEIIGVFGRPLEELLSLELVANEDQVLWPAQVTNP